MSNHSTKTTDGGLDPNGVFVVRLREASPPGELSGRVECVPSGQRVSFGSTEELIAFMLRRTGGAAKVDDGR